MKKFYITTTLPYVNAEPHIGFALEIIQADVIARYQRLIGNKVFFNTGTDEHGLKIYRKTNKKKNYIQKYVDRHAKKYDQLKSALNLSYNAFIRTTSQDHVAAAQEFWKHCDANGDIYKKNYKIKYCVGCELEKTESELEDGRCPIHYKLELEIIEEENYFFKFSKYQDKLLNLYKKNSNFVVPKHRLSEVKNFVTQGLNDFSISRLRNKLPWGIPVPNDPDHVMYVWFDALINYISTLGWPKKGNFEEFWPGIQVAGKDNLRQQSAMWQAMLLSAGLPTTSQIFIHGFINFRGSKISKSLGNTIDPFILVKKYGSEVVRYYLLRYIHPVEDSDFSIAKLEAAYQADLANGLGNLVSRVTGLIEQNSVSVKISQNKVPSAPFASQQVRGDLESNREVASQQVRGDLELNREVGAGKISQDREFSKLIDGFLFDQALKYIWDKIGKIDALISESKPWELAKAGKTKEIKKILEKSANTIYEISQLLKPFLPETAEKVEKIITAKKIRKAEPLFPRLEL